MTRQFIALLVSAALVVPQWSCATTKSVTISGAELAEKGKNAGSIVSVATKSGDFYTFADDDPAKIVNFVITGQAITRVAFQQVTKRSVSIPLADVDTAEVRRPSDAGGVLWVLVGMGLIAALLAGNHKSDSPPPGPQTSCPFVYSFDGRDYVMDAEPYGGAISRGLARTDWARLEHLEAVDAEYRIRLTNELDETEYVDEAKLVVVDHPVGTTVAPDLLGWQVTFTGLVPPSRASDRHGRDLTAILAKGDRHMWHTPAQDALGADAPVKDELIVEFPKPPGARQAKLLVNAATTLWGSRMVREFLGLHGESLESYYSTIDQQGRLPILAWAARDDVYAMHVRVATPKGWENRGWVIGGGSLLSEDRASTFDVSDLPGETLRIQLSPAAAFWAIDMMNVDYSDSPPAKGVELAAERAQGQAGEDLRPLLLATDQKSYVMPRGGTRAELSFRVPPPVPGQARTLFVKLNGYYRIALEGVGPAQRAVLDRFDEPGFPVRWSLERYREAHAEEQALLARR